MKTTHRTYKGTCWCCGGNWSNDPDDGPKYGHRWSCRAHQVVEPGLPEGLLIAGSDQYVCENCDKQIKRQKGVEVSCPHFKTFRKNEEKYLANASVTFRLWRKDSGEDMFFGPRKLTPAGNPVGGKLVMVD